MQEALRIVALAPDLNVTDPSDTHALDQAERSRSLRIGLLQSGFNLMATLPANTFLHERLAQLQPDLVILDAENDARDALEHVVMATRDARRPIVMFTNDSARSSARAAVAAGVQVLEEARQRSADATTGLSEHTTAYEKLRKSAMDKGLKLGEVSQRMLDSIDLLG